MKPSFHEDFSRKDEVRGSSNRGFGLTVGGILLTIAAVRAGLHLWDGTDPGWIEGALAGVGVLRPPWFRAREPVVAIEMNSRPRSRRRMFGRPRLRARAPRAATGSAPRPRPCTGA